MLNPSPTARAHSAGRTLSAALLLSALILIVVLVLRSRARDRIPVAGETSQGPPAAGPAPDSALADTTEPHRFAQPATPPEQLCQERLQALDRLLAAHAALHAGTYPARITDLDPSLGQVVRLDPWGAEFLYNSPGNRAPYQLYSLGADGQIGGEGEDTDVFLAP